MSERASGELLYVTPYLNDPAVHRRLRMLRLGGMDRLSAVGFRRTPAAISDIEGVPATDLGRTEDARLGRRAATLAAALLRTRSWGRALGAPPLVLARSLEALLLAHSFRRRFAPGARLAYETLDIHRALLGAGRAARALRAVEGRLLRQCDLVLTSSPAFVSEYFTRHHPGGPEVLVVENRMLAVELPQQVLDAVTSEAMAGPRPGPPWRIGWFGLLRCTRSLHLLAALCRRLHGQVVVDIRGRPAAGMSTEFGRIVAATPGMTFGGPYDRGRDLSELYTGVHFSWTPDFSEPGANSDWLLPNRLYEAGPFGCVPLAVRGVETGRWLASHGVGVLFDEPLLEGLTAWFEHLEPRAYAEARRAVLDRPLSDFVDGREAAQALVARLRSLRSGGGMSSSSSEGGRCGQILA
jgi:succinoglycan biosynthesis protein ExoL